MPYIGFLSRIRRLITVPSPHFDIIADAFADGRLRQPAQPMSDHELARAIRDFQSVPISERALKTLATQLLDPKPER